jgi:hypothetical protein
MSSNSAPTPSVQTADHPETQTRRQKSAGSVFLFTALLWGFVVTAGLWWLSGYQNTPGTALGSPRNWPANSRIQPARDEYTLVMLAHPHCPCTRASIGELAKIMTNAQGRMRAYVLFIQPAGSTPDWATTDLWESASQIPGVYAVKDQDALEARHFNAATSGQTIVYDPQGQLVFSGGITASRGHFGDNAGESSIISIVNAQAPIQTETSVFGCPLFNSQSDCQVKIDENKHH